MCLCLLYAEDADDFNLELFEPHLQPVPLSFIKRRPFITLARSKELPQMLKGDRLGLKNDVEVWWGHKLSRQLQSYKDSRNKDPFPIGDYREVVNDRTWDGKKMVVVSRFLGWVKLCFNVQEPGLEFFLDGGKVFMWLITLADQKGDQEYTEEKIKGSICEINGVLNYLMEACDWDRRAIHIIKGNMKKLLNWGKNFCHRNHLKGGIPVPSLKVANMVGGPKFQLKPKVAEVVQEVQEVQEGEEVHEVVHKVQEVEEVQEVQEVTNVHFTLEKQQGLSTAIDGLKSRAGGLESLLQAGDHSYRAGGGGGERVLFGLPISLPEVYVQEEAGRMGL